jgi:hypothetical protein
MFFSTNFAACSRALSVMVVGVMAGQGFTTKSITAHINEHNIAPAIIADTPAQKTCSFVGSIVFIMSCF